MNVLVTGFGPFPGVPHNVSSELAEQCAEHWSRRSNVEAEVLLLATDWNTAPATVAQHVARTRPDIIVHLGVSERARHLVLETHAYNACCDTLDVTGLSAPSVQRHTGPIDHLCSRAPVALIAERLSAAGHAVTVSDDPGRYLCNAVYHETLTLNATLETSARAIFIHIPTNLNTDTITHKTALAGLDIVLDTMMAH